MTNGLLMIIVFASVVKQYYPTQAFYAEYCKNVSELLTFVYVGWVWAVITLCHNFI